MYDDKESCRGKSIPAGRREKNNAERFNFLHHKNRYAALKCTRMHKSLFHIKGMENSN